MTFKFVRPSEANDVTLRLGFDLREEFCRAAMEALEAPIQTALFCQHQTKELKAIGDRHDLEINQDLRGYFVHLVANAIASEAGKLKIRTGVSHKQAHSLVAACAEHGHGARVRFTKQYDPRHEL